jgi:ubiquinone/menaquinone biosynthesis C-methylase UbiE
MVDFGLLISDCRFSFCICYSSFFTCHWDLAIWIWVFIALLLLALLIYWELVVCEGTHLGPRVVVWLYDLVAPRYEQVKKFKLDLDDNYIGWPLAVKLAEVEQPRILDVAAGTGRVARSLLRQVAFDGVVVNLELSVKMMVAGQPHWAAWPGRTRWLRGPADRLPFADNTFDAVTCLEALEFLPSPRAAVAECVRVLRPGGWLLTTNRAGLSAPLLVGKSYSRAAFRELLAGTPLEAVRVVPWQAEYDLAWGRKGF